MTKHDHTEEELLAFLSAIEIHDVMLPGEITVDGFAKLRGVSRSVAERVLKREVESGRIVRRKARIDGKSGYAYRQADK